MRVLVVDRTAEGQTQLAARLDRIDSGDQESMDLQVRLASQKEYRARLSKTDVLILGADLGTEAGEVALFAKERYPDIEIIMFVTGELYSSGTFRTAHISRVRKVIPLSASELDLLQELVTIHEHLRSEGRVTSGNVVLVTQAKGGVGATTISAALAEVCSANAKRTMLWDFDIETEDLSRGLTTNGIQGALVTAWVEGSRELNRNSLHDALIPVSNVVSLLRPPHELPAALDLVGHSDGIEIVRRILSLARLNHDNIIIDSGGRLGPAIGTLMRLADEIIVVVDDSVLGLSGVGSYLNSVKFACGGNLHVRFLCSGTRLSKKEMRAVIDGDNHYGDRSWNLPVVPSDSAGATWPGQGKTLYSLGKKSTRKALDEVAGRLGLIENEEADSGGFGKRQNILTGRWKREKAEDDTPQVGNL